MPSASSSERFPLLPHPSSQRGEVRELGIRIDRPSAAELKLEYRLEADLEALRIPEPRVPSRTDGLWRHTCFEAFIAQPGGHAYWEYNFSPSGAWAAYHFSGYREGMTALLKGAAPVIQVDSAGDEFVLEVAVDLSWLTRAGASALRLSAAAVIEDRARVLSYWALKHPAEKPDFHHADSFVVPLD
jgi:hypothetical protein